MRKRSDDEIRDRIYYCLAHKFRDPSRLNKLYKELQNLGSDDLLKKAKELLPHLKW